MNWFDKLFNKSSKSGSVAKSRLQMVLTHDRADISPGILAAIKDDIIAVIARHLAIDAESVEVNLDQTGRENRLIAQIPLHPNGRR